MSAAIENPVSLLVEIGTEELPPKSLGRLAESFATSLKTQLEEAELAPGAVEVFSTPRRMAVRIDALRSAQPDREEHRLGPALAAAFDEEGRPTKAAEGFARSVGATVEDLDREATDKGERLSFRRQVSGQPAADLLPELIARALKQLPVPKPMRWSNLSEAFVRPVHWIVALLGDEVVPGELYGQPFGRDSRGHRFLSPDAVSLTTPAGYVDRLREAYVLVEPAQRRAMIREQAGQQAAEAGGTVVLREELVDEVANLVEWPAAVRGEFEPEFLEVPQEALISSMEIHQRFFPVVDEEGALMAHFIGFANIQSLDAAVVQRGYERVIRPRLADARFFWNQDRKQRLEDRTPALEAMVYQDRLGSLADKCTRVGQLAEAIAKELGEEPETVTRAAALAKCDLVTAMVDEFPELQGTMGRYYALHQDESEEVAAAIEDHYRPRFAGDDLPASTTSRILAIADRLDTLAGIFAAGLKPSGNKDPYALRRAALGLVRLLVEDGPDLDLSRWIDQALAGIADRIDDAPEQADEVLQFVMERMRRYYADQGVGADAFEAVWARRPTRLKDFHARVQACQVFRVLEPAAALAAANKRIGNILRKAKEAGEAIDGTVDEGLLAEDAEQALSQSVRAAAQDSEPLVKGRDYRGALERLAALRPEVDQFFDDVMVMTDDAETRANRLALLAGVKQLFDSIADISHLVIDQPEAAG